MLYMVNFDPLLKRIQSTLHGWSNKFLNWMEHIMLLKSIVLSQFLFVFRTLPIHIPLSRLNKWQCMFTDFVWAQKSHRVNRSVLSRPTKIGGFGLPLLHSYYVAAQLHVVPAYLQDSMRRSWVHIKERCVTPFILCEIFWNKPMDRPQLYRNNQFLKLTLTVWHNYRSLLTSNFSA